MIAGFKRAVSSSRRALVSWCTAAFLAACGGGGESGPDPSAMDFPLESSISRYAQTVHQYSLKGRLDGRNFTANLNFTPGTEGTFEGRPAQTAMQTLTISEGSVLAAQTTVTSYYSINPYVIFGSIDRGDGSYTVYSQSGTLPASAKVGQSGVFGTARRYVNATKRQVTATSTSTWSVEADTATTALFCLHIVISGGVSGTGSECYRVDGTGQVLGLVVTVNVLGKTLTLR